MITLTSKEKKWTWLFLLPFYFLYGQYLFSIVFLLIGWVFNLNIINESTDAYFNLLYLGFVSVCALYVFKPFLKKSIQHMKGRWIREIIYSCTSGTLKFYCANIVSSLLIMLMNMNGSSANQDAIVEMTSTAPMVMFITTVFFAPFLEEMIFRVGLFQMFFSKSRLLAYMISGLGFGFVHIMVGLFAGDLSQLLYWIPYSLLGFMLCHIYEKRDTIFAPMIVHMMNNLIAMLIVI